MNPYIKIASQTYKKFSDLEGNEFIAGDYALEVILRIIKDFKVQKILEIGLGIGSISDAILEYSEQNKANIIYYGTEANNFCLSHLPKNVNHYQKINLFNDISEIDSDIKFDFIIVDGSDESLSVVRNMCAENAIIFIEGGRAVQVNALKKIFKSSVVAEIISKRRPPIYGPFHQKWTGGGSLIFIKPTVYQKAYWFKEKVKTFIKRRLRKFIQK